MPDPSRPEPATPSATALVVLGWREWLALPDLGIRALRAKVDTGARSSALHVDALETEFRGGVEWVRFHPGSDGVFDSTIDSHWAEAPVLDRRFVTDSGGHRTERIFIRTTLNLAGASWPVEINLSHRRNMLFPMLLGRTAMAGRFLVDPQRSFILGEPDADQAGPPVA
ncbi:MAG: ATP-dependent zinc protease family protein [Silanimonas sp.]